VDGDEVRVVFCHHLQREALIYRRLEETQNKGTLHRGRFPADCSTFGSNAQRHRTHAVTGTLLAQRQRLLVVVRGTVQRCVTQRNTAGSWAGELHPSGAAVCSYSFTAVDTGAAERAVCHLVVPLGRAFPGRVLASRACLSQAQAVAGETRCWRIYHLLAG